MDKQIKAWIDNNEEQYHFWCQVSQSEVSCGGLNKTTAEAKELASYFKGRFDLACGMDTMFIKFKASHEIKEHEPIILTNVADETLYTIKGRLLTGGLTHTHHKDVVGVGQAQQFCSELKEDNYDVWMEKQGLFNCLVCGTPWEDEAGAVHCPCLDEPE